jgi:hypothetical protein
LCADFSSKGARIDVVDERTAPVDLDHRQPFAVPRLELRIPCDVDLAEVDPGLAEDAAGALAEVTALRVEEDDVGYG